MAPESPARREFPEAKDLRTYLAAAEIVLALAGWALGLLGALTGREPLATYLYLFAWWPYIFFLDGLLFFIKGESWVLNRPGNFFCTLPWSVTFWLIFEAFNLVLQNWRYAGMVPQWWARWPGYVLAFATVLPGVLLTARVLEALGAWGKARGRPLELGPWPAWSLLLGTACVVLPLAVPHLAFPLIWLALISLLDPVCLLLGGESLLARFAAGERRQVLCLLAAGLVCGFWWELWNYPATSHWVYSLPAFNFWKVFQMPLLGYLGFLPFALECRVMYNFIQALEAAVLKTPKSRGLALLCQVAFWVLMFAALDAWTVISYQSW
jgi:hypothetical protein